MRAVWAPLLMVLFSHVVCTVRHDLGELEDPVEVDSRPGSDPRKGAIAYDTKKSDSLTSQVLMPSNLAERIRNL
jgi:hypothetical protein